MVLGSFLSRYFYLLLALFFLFKSKLNKNLIFFSYILFFLISLLIFFSGERAAFFNFSLGLFLLLLTLNYLFVIHSNNLKNNNFTILKKKIITI